MTGIAISDYNRHVEDMTPVSFIVQTEEYIGAENFVYWLQGYFEIGNPDSLDPHHIKIIVDHLEKVDLNKQGECRDFAIWLKGFLSSINHDAILSGPNLISLKNKINELFKKITPIRNPLGNTINTYTDGPTITC